MSDAPREPTPEPRAWPPGQALPDSQAVRTECPGCGQPWRVHPALAGFRLRCHCGATVAVPRVASARRDALPELLPDALPTPPAAPPPASLPAAPLPRTTAARQRRLVDRTILELVAMLAAFVVPSLALQWSVTGPAQALWMPVAALASSLLVLLVAHTDRSAAFAGLRATAPRFGAEALLAAGAALAVAAGWVALLRAARPELRADDLATLQHQLGAPMTLFVVALCPALFEELAFRGLLHARLGALFTPGYAALVGGVAFALAHGVTLGFPLHAGLGVYLSFLRLRSGSLWPGMLTHLTYNAGVVLWL